MIEFSVLGLAGEHIVGLDNFGRVADQKWVNSSGTAVDEYQYGYDNDGNVLFKKNMVSSSNSELYMYDGLNRLATMKRGTLSSGNTAITSPTYEQDWNLDAQGNWDGSSGVTTNSTAQSRSHNKQNQITAVGSNSLTYDANGNTLTDGLGHTYQYDAWNRMAYADNNTNYERYGYDALGRRITTTDPQEVPTGVGENSTGGGGGDDDTITINLYVDHYYTTQWQDVEDDRNAIRK